MLRLLFLVILACAGALAPSRACARGAENRTWDFFPTVAETRQETAPQVAGLHQGNLECGYDFASGCCLAAETTAARTLTTAEEGLFSRVSRPKGFKEQVWEINKGPDGLVRDPTGKVLKFDEPWELGHTPGNKFSDAQIRAAEQGWDRATWIKYQNDPYIY